MQMKINRAFWLFIAVFVASVAAVGATENWMSAATVQIEKKGLVDSILPPELHRARDNNRLDLVLIGPDGNRRAFELYMRSSGEAQTMSLNAEKETLLDDGRILWEASLPPDYFFDSLSFFVNAANFTGKVDIEASYDGVWQTIATGSLLSPRGAGSGAVVTFAEAAYDRVRCYFSGFDRHFKQTAIFVQSVEATGRKTGSDYESVFLTTKVEQSTTEDGLEARIFLPGSGLRFEEIEVLTSAQFKGDWQTGREKLNLGQREFIPVDGGRVDAFGEEPQKLLISYPRIRSALMDFLTVTILREAGFEAFDNIAGGETAGIPFAALVAERLALPMTYVRKKPKGYGRNARIEGAMTEGQRVLLVEDLTTDGGSKLSFVDAIRETGATCSHTAVIFYYGIFPETTEKLAAHGVQLLHLCTWWDVLAEARASGAFDAATLTEVEQFLTDPRAWQAARSK